MAMKMYVALIMACGLPLLANQAKYLRNASQSS